MLFVVKTGYLLDSRKQQADYGILSRLVVEVPRGLIRNLSGEDICETNFVKCDSWNSARIGWFLVVVTSQPAPLDKNVSRSQG